jgi:WS/DGAT/MGAT family acyltransferase
VAPVAATRFNRPVGAHRVWDARRFALEDAKRIKRAVAGASINDVALAWMGGALRTYLSKHGELPPGPLVALMPISLRATSTRQSAATEVEASRGGNRFAMANIPMGTDIEDPLERVAAIMARTRTAKEFALDAPSLVEWSEALPGALAGTAQRAVIRLANRTGRTMGVHMIVTNVPGPQNPLYFDGARCLFTSGMAPVVDGMGIIHAVTSYQGPFVACFTADRDMMPDPSFYANCIDESFADLREAAGAG